MQGLIKTAILLSSVFAGPGISYYNSVANAQKSQAQWNHDEFQAEGEDSEWNEDEFQAEGDSRFDEFGWIKEPALRGRGSRGGVEQGKEVASQIMVSTLTALTELYESLAKLQASVLALQFSMAHN